MKHMVCITHYGGAQTVPRSELSAVTPLVEMVEVNAVIVYIGDNKPVIDLFQKETLFALNHPTRTSTKYCSVTLKRNA